MAGFIFGGAGMPKTPQELERLRAIADAFAAPRGTPTTIGSGLAALGDAIAYRKMMGRADKAEATGNASAASTMNPILQAFLGGDAASPAPATPAAPTPPNVDPTVTNSIPAAKPAAPVAAAAAPTNPDWLTYANTGAIRNEPLSPKLVGDLNSFLPDMGVTMKVFSGGQEAAGPRRTGSHRHDGGNAADVFFYKDGRQLDWNNPQDVPLFQQIVERARQAGITGFGAGPGYMQPGSMHIGFGTPNVWGAGGRSANAPDWLRQAFNESVPAAGPQVAATSQPQLPATGPVPTPRPTTQPGIISRIASALSNAIVPSAAAAEMPQPQPGVTDAGGTSLGAGLPMASVAPRNQAGYQRMDASGFNPYQVAAALMSPAGPSINIPAGGPQVPIPAQMPTGMQTPVPTPSPRPEMPAPNMPVPAQMPGGMQTPVPVPQPRPAMPLSAGAFDARFNGAPRLPQQGPIVPDRPNVAQAGVPVPPFASQGVDGMPTGAVPVPQAAPARPQPAAPVMPAAATEPAATGSQIDLPTLLKAASNPWVANNPLYSGILSKLVEMKLAERMPMSPLQKIQLQQAQATYEKTLIDLHNAQNPQQFHVLSADEKAQMGLPKEGTFQVGSDGKISAIGTPSTNVNVNTGGSEMFAGLPKDVRDEMFKRQSAAQDAADVIKITNEGRQILDSGIISGAGANMKIEALKWATALGIPVDPSAADNAQAFKAVMGQAVGKIIKQFGSGTGLSDADRQYAERIVGGDVTLDEPAIRRIFDIADKAARGQIEHYRTIRDKVLGGDLSSILDVNEPPAYQPPQPSGSTSSGVKWSIEP
ncbi:MAG: hypothetical protein BGN85_09425 [Alphaproteobacteria bacterium 64-11]|jgi:hypothetical protein|nr:MAG: hypothetical protein BGN85_09425 [Alphaproteobacteria bacterium 64-11]